MNVIRSAPEVFCSVEESFPADVRRSHLFIPYIFVSLCGRVDLCVWCIHPTYHGRLCSIVSPPVCLSVLSISGVVHGGDYLANVNAATASLS
jgi:hypothetical protein